MTYHPCHKVAKPIGADQLHIMIGCFTFLFMCPTLAMCLFKSLVIMKMTARPYGCHTLRFCFKNHPYWTISFCFRAFLRSKRCQDFAFSIKLRATACNYTSTTKNRLYLKHLDFCFLNSHFNMPCGNVYYSIRKNAIMMHYMDEPLFCRGLIREEVTVPSIGSTCSWWNNYHQRIMAHHVIQN